LFLLKEAAVGRVHLMTKIALCTEDIGLRPLVINLIRLIHFRTPIIVMPIIRHMVILRTILRTRTCIKKMRGFTKVPIQEMPLTFVMQTIAKGKRTLLVRKSSIENIQIEVSNCWKEKEKKLFKQCEPIFVCESIKPKNYFLVMTLFKLNN